MTTPRPSPETRRAEGKALRDVLRREDQGAWRPAQDRPDIIGLLSAAVAHRHPDLLPIRWARMAKSPFYFYRGNAALMAYDLKPRPPAGPQAQPCGHAPPPNFRPAGSQVGTTSRALWPP